MIRIDRGNDLLRILQRAEQVGQQAYLDVAMPFFHSRSRLARQLVTVVRKGVPTRLLTRPADNASHSGLISSLEDMGAKIVSIPHLHAKAVLLCLRRPASWCGWIGSLNFLPRAEELALDLGIAFFGRGTTEALLAQQCQAIFANWERNST